MVSMIICMWRMLFMKINMWGMLFMNMWRIWFMKCTTVKNVVHKACEVRMLFQMLMHKLWEFFWWSEEYFFKNRSMWKMCISIIMCMLKTVANTSMQVIFYNHTMQLQGLFSAPNCASQIRPCLRDLSVNYNKGISILAVTDISTNYPCQVVMLSYTN